MIVEEIKRSIRVSGEFEQIPMGIDDEDMPYVLKLLSAPYSNPIKAVIREYSTNAFDEHVKHGILRKPIITLPSTFKPEIKIRDFGKGLSEELVRNIYAKYGKSTKRVGADANLFNGQIGIGAKSGLCYGGKTFTVSSHVDGELTVYKCYLNENDAPTYAKLFSTETSEPNGLEISIPVEAGDVNKFVQEASNVYAYFNELPEIQNAPVDFKAQRPETLHGLEGSNFRITGTRESYIVMGNVAYPIDVKQLDDQYGIEANLIKAGVEITVPIGYVSMAISRESLEYTPKTKANLNLLIAGVIEELSGLIEQRFTNASNLWEAKILYHNTFRGLGGLGNSLRNVLSGKVNWNGKDISSNLFQWDNKLKGVKVVAFSNSYYKEGSQRQEKTNTIVAAENNIVVFNDLGTGKGSPLRIKELFKKEKPDHVYVVLFDDDAAKAEFINKLDFDTVPIRLLTQIDKPVVTKVAAGPNAKHQLSCFKWDKSKVRHGMNSAAWQPDTIDIENGKGVYVIIDRFEAKGLAGKQFSPYYLRNMLEKLEKLGVKIPEIYAVKPVALNKKKMGAGWVNLWDYVKTELDGIAGGVGQSIIDYNEALHNGSSNFRSLNESVDKMSPTSPLRKYITEYNRMYALGTSSAAQKEQEIIDAYKTFGFQFINVFTPTTNLQELIKEVYDTYKLLPAFDNYRIRSYKEQILDYVNMVDKQGVKGV